MKSISSVQASVEIDKFIFEASEHHQPIQIVGENSNGVLIGEEDWNSISETLFLLSIPGMGKSIRAGMKVKLKNTSESLDW